MSERGHSPRKRRESSISQRERVRLPHAAQTQRLIGGQDVKIVNHFSDLLVDGQSGGLGLGNGRGEGDTFDLEGDNGEIAAERGEDQTRKLVRDGVLRQINGGESEGVVEELAERSGTGVSDVVVTEGEALGKGTGGDEMKERWMNEREEKCESERKGERKGKWRSENVKKSEKNEISHNHKK